MEAVTVRQIAVFIDFENLAIGAEDDLPGMGTRAVPYRALDHLCQGRGTATVRRAYADWAKPRFGKYQEDLGLNGVDLIQVARFGGAQKNAADIRMAVDAMETLITHPDIAEYVLVAGDGDYSPLVQRLREFGKAVVGVGTQASASPRLVSVCTEYKYWGTLVADVDPTATTAMTAVTAAFDVFDAVDLLVRAMTLLNETSTSQDDEGWLFAGEIKNMMLRLDPSFDQSNYRVRNFSAFLDLPPLRRAVEVRRAGLRLDVRLLTRSVAPAEIDAGSAASAGADGPAEPGDGTTRSAAGLGRREQVAAQADAIGPAERDGRGPTTPPASPGQRALKRATWAMPTLDEQGLLLGAVFDGWTTRTGSLDEVLEPVAERLVNARLRSALQFVLVHGGLLTLEPLDLTGEQVPALRSALVQAYDGAARELFIRRGAVIWLARSLFSCDVAGLREDDAIADPVFDSSRDDPRFAKALELSRLVDEQLGRLPGELRTGREWFDAARGTLADMIGERRSAEASS